MRTCPRLPNSSNSPPERGRYWLRRPTALLLRFSRGQPCLAQRKSDRHTQMLMRISGKPSESGHGARPLSGTPQDPRQVVWDSPVPLWLVSPRDSMYRGIRATTKQPRFGAGRQDGPDAHAVSIHQESLAANPRTTTSKKPSSPVRYRAGPSTKKRHRVVSSPGVAVSGAG